TPLLDHISQLTSQFHRYFFIPMYKITKPDFINNFIWIYELSRINTVGKNISAIILSFKGQFE
ncbi:MAG TPA: hypothetical protein PLQ47_09105, partial [Candidatus Marinimicrobia bacterium]|nr:hypothetical protein [Candidatus Neomarinimicrobiota bacterium]